MPKTGIKFSLKNQGQQVMQYATSALEKNVNVGSFLVLRRKTGRRNFLFYSLDAHDKVHIIKLSSLFSAYNKEYNRRMHPRFAPSFVRYSRAVLEQNSLAQSITLDIIFYRNIVIFKRWHYAETYKTDLSIFEYESNRVCKAT